MSNSHIYCSLQKSTPIINFKNWPNDEKDQKFNGNDPPYEIENHSGISMSTNQTPNTSKLPDLNRKIS